MKDHDILAMKQAFAADAAFKRGMRELSDVREVTDLQATPQDVRRYVPTGSVDEKPISE